MAGEASSSTRIPELIPGVLAVGVFVAWAAADGGFEPTASNPGALFLLGLLAAVALASRRFSQTVPQRQAWAVAALVAFAVWAFISVLWADDQGVAWDGANRVLLYATVVALFALLPASSVGAPRILGLYSLAIAALVAGFFLATVASDDPGVHFLDGRFAEPTGYHNANVALLMGAFWPALFLSSRRETPWPARGLLFAAAGLVLELALMTQSRGWLVVLPIAAVLYLACVPQRLRTLVVAMPLAAMVALTAGPLLDVVPAAQDGIDLAGALHDARTAILASVAALAVSGCLIGLLDDRIRVPERVQRRLQVAVATAATIAALAGTIVALVVIGNPVNWAEERWEDFKGGQATISGSRFGESLGSNRYDFWRVAVDQFTDSPIGGAGIDNFAADYLRDRDTNEEPLHPHSQPLAVLGQTGLVGTALFGAFLALSLSALLQAWRSPPDPLARGIVGVSAVTTAYWFLHGAGDWFWAMPAITAPALAWLAMSARLGPAPDREGERRPLPRLLILPAAALAAFALATYALPWAAARDVEEAQRIWPDDPDGAFERLDQARQLNFLSAEPDLAAGAIAARLGDRRRMRTSFERALERNPQSWYAHLQLGALDALENRRVAAIEELQEARRLNPGDPTIRVVLRRTAAGKPLTLPAIRAELVARICDRLGRTQGTSACPS